jgi:hypothetical protein
VLDLAKESRVARIVLEMMMPWFFGMTDNAKNPQIASAVVASVAVLVMDVQVLS